MCQNHVSFQRKSVVLSSEGSIDQTFQWDIVIGYFLRQWEKSYQCIVNCVSSSNTKPLIKVAAHLQHCTYVDCASLKILVPTIDVSMNILIGMIKAPAK